MVFFDLDITVIEWCMFAVGHDQISSRNYGDDLHFSERFTELSDVKV